MVEAFANRDEQAALKKRRVDIQPAAIEAVVYELGGGDPEACKPPPSKDPCEREAGTPRESKGLRCTRSARAQWCGRPTAPNSMQ